MGCGSRASAASINRLASEAFASLSLSSLLSLLPSSSLLAVSASADLEGSADASPGVSEADSLTLSFSDGA